MVIKMVITKYEQQAAKREATTAPGGTSTQVWAGWNQQENPVYGKTGTAERAGHVEQSWYMCYLGNAQRPIVIAVTVEEGGFGAETAAPIARLIASQWYGKPKKFVDAPRARTRWSKGNSWR